jgi:MFS family permease
MMHAAFINWMPTVMTRRHNMPIGEVGLDMGIVVGIGALIGYWGGGWLADYWLSKGKKDAHLRVGLVAGIGLGPMAIGAVLSPDASWSLFFTGGVFVFATLSASAGLAGLQLVTPSTLRGQVTALYILVASLVGVGTGPFLVGFLTDVVFGSKNAVHFSLLTTSLIAVPLMIGTSLFGLKPFGQLMKSREAMA